MRFPLESTVANPLLWAPASVAAAGAACVAYGTFVERRWYRRADYRLDVLPPDASGSLRIVHVSDLHFVAGDRRKARVPGDAPPARRRGGPGDLLGEPEGVEDVVAAIRPIRGRLASLFVLGSNDYWAPKPLNYSAYFRKDRPKRPGVRSRTGELLRRLEADGWVHLQNRRTELARDGVRFEVLGLDDPHIERHDLRMAPRRDPGAFGMAIVHSPDPVPELVAFGYRLILSGHTHGGQVRMPFVGALITNSQIPTRLCMGLSRFGDAYLHISPGLGTSKYAPFRFLCRPEATVLDLVPAARRPTPDLSWVPR